ncbi:hypothetical cytosolic protein [Streptococcus pneumoniae]|nr:hypothetical cytosolic protein [Streptococcus pneumoniae]
MKIRMRNTIQFDEQLEVIDQLYDVEVHEKGDYSYLLFYNEEKEKVVIKFHGQELVMSRFSNPKTIMRFLKDSDSLAYIPHLWVCRSLPSKRAIIKLIGKRLN